MFTTRTLIHRNKHRRMNTLILFAFQDAASREYEEEVRYGPGGSEGDTSDETQSDDDVLDSTIDIDSLVDDVYVWPAREPWYSFMLRGGSCLLEATARDVFDEVRVSYQRMVVKLLVRRRTGLSKHCYCFLDLLLWQQLEFK